MSRETNDCDVYVIAKCGEASDAFESPCKIGITQNIELRLKAVQTFCPYRVGVVWTFMFLNREFAETIERAFHSSHTLQHLHGEWFDIESLAAIKDICKISRALIPGFTPPRFIEQATDFANVEWAERKFGFLGGSNVIQ